MQMYAHDVITYIHCIALNTTSKRDEHVTSCMPTLTYWYLLVTGNITLLYIQETMRQKVATFEGKKADKLTCMGR